MNFRLMLGLAAFALGSAIPASAVTFHFDLSGSRSAMFDIDASRAPDSFTPTQTFFDATPGIYSATPGTADISFSKDFFGGPGGGFEAINFSLLGFSQFMSSEVLFTGTTAQPVFKTGAFQLTSIVAGASTLTITQMDGGESTVPEPASWALLVSGFGLVGGAVRRRRGVAAA